MEELHPFAFDPPPLSPEEYKSTAFNILKSHSRTYSLGLSQEKSESSASKLFDALTTGRMLSFTDALLMDSTLQPHTSSELKEYTNIAKTMAFRHVGSKSSFVNDHGALYLYDLFFTEQALDPDHLSEEDVNLIKNGALWDSITTKPDYYDVEFRKEKEWTSAARKNLLVSPEFTPDPQYFTKGIQLIERNNSRPTMIDWSVDSFKGYINLASRVHEQDVKQKHKDMLFKPIIEEVYNATTFPNHVLENEVDTIRGNPIIQQYWNRNKELVEDLDF